MSIYHQILGVPAPTVLLEEEQMKEANFKAFIYHVNEELKKARNEQELLDMLDWAKRRINQGL